MYIYNFSDRTGNKEEFKMKKISALILAGAMVFAFAGCSDTENGNDIDNPATDVQEEVVEKINMVYGDDEIKITLSKPENAVFTLGSDTPEDAGDLVGLCAEDYSWDAEVMGYKYYEAIGSNVPFVDYYFAGNVNEEEYTAYEQEITDLGIAYNGNPVQAIRYTFSEVDDEESYTECFVGFEYKGSADCGLMGIKLVESEGELSDDELKTLFTELFGIN